MSYFVWNISPLYSHYRIARGSHISSIIHSVITVCQTHVEWVSGQCEVFTLVVSTGLPLSSQTYCDTWRGGKWRGRGGDASEWAPRVSYQKRCTVDYEGGHIWRLNWCVDKIDTDSSHWFIQESQGVYLAYQLQEHKENISPRSNPSAFVIHYITHPHLPSSLPASIHPPISLWLTVGCVGSDWSWTMNLAHNEV